MTNGRLTCRDIYKSWAGEESAANEAAIREHLSQCAACAGEKRVFELATVDGECGPAAPLDDLARRRFIDAVLSQARRGRRESPSRPLAWVAAAIVLIAGAAVAILGIRMSGGADGGFVKSALVAAKGQTLLASGDVRFSGGDDRVGPGDEVTTGSGTWLGLLRPGLEVELAPDSSLRVAALGPRGSELRLERGRIIGRVTPEILKEGQVTIITPHGSVVITGTVFTITCSEDGAFVSVLRGKVRVLAPSGRSREVKVGQMAQVDDGLVEPMPESEHRAMTAAVARFDVVRGSDTRWIEISSIPAGADVLIDDVPLGVTPVRAQVSSGDHRLSLRMEGFAPVNELVYAGAQGALARTFELQATSKILPRNGEGSGEVVRDPARPENEANRRSAKKKPAVRRDPGVRTPGQHRTATASELLEAATALRGERRWVKSAATYELLVQRHPESSEAQAALIALGQLELDELGRPRKAAASFGKYLRSNPKGRLAEEASLGKARALAAAGDFSGARQQCRRLLENYPNTFGAGFCSNLKMDPGE